MAIVRTHRPVWHQERCLPCHACTHECPVTVFPELSREEDSLRGRVARNMLFPHRHVDVPPCQAACPLDQDVPGYLKAIAAGDSDRALRIILRTNPFPSVCGRLCLRACEHACVRGTLDDPVAIRELKRAAVELAGHGVPKATPKIKNGSVAVVGAGPAGLSAAYFLARAGRRVIVYEAAERPGGLLSHAIPSFDLPSASLQVDLKFIQASGVEIRCGQAIDGPAALDKLFADGAGAVILAVGAGNGLRLGIENEDVEGCFDALSFARGFHEKTGDGLSGPAVVAGSGNMAVSVARMAVRAGAGPVSLVMRRGLRESPCDHDKLRLAREEGVEIVEEMRPWRVVGDGAIESILVMPVSYGPVDHMGRRWPRNDVTGDRHPGLQLPAATFIAAEERAVDLSFLGEWAGEMTGPLGCLQVDPVRIMTSRRGIFGAGEVVTGSRNVVAAIASGSRAAVEVNDFLEEVDTEN